MLQTVEHATAKTPAWSVIWLHGLGADGNDFVPIVPELVRPGWPGIRFVFPHAPVRPVSINGGARLRAWYDIVSTELDKRADETGLRESMGELDRLIARERDRGVPLSRIVLAGFSQGGAVVLAHALRQRVPVAGVMALSTYLPLGGKNAEERTPESASIPVFMAHGAFDPVIPLGLGEHSRRQLQTFGLDVRFKSYPMQHSVCAEEIRDMADWLGERFAAR
ncbi:MAG: dienelactone hydrolase family protein [Arenimonas sp.]|nr:dienelactone hydrolase family protein [Arenimonas sp.]